MLINNYTWWYHFTLVHPIACGQDFLPDPQIYNLTVRDSQAGCSLLCSSELMDTDCPVAEQACPYIDKP